MAETGPSNLSAERAAERKLEPRTLTFDQQMGLMEPTLKKFFSQDIAIVAGNSEILGITQLNLAQRWRVNERRPELAGEIKDASSKLSTALNGLTVLLTDRRTRTLEVDVADPESPAIALDRIATSKPSIDAHY